MVAQMTNSSQMAASSSSWTKLEDKLFESALSESSYQTGSSEPNWETLNPMISGRDSLDLKKHFEMLVQDVASIEAGLVPMPDYADSLSSPSASEEAACESPKTRKAGSVGHVSSVNGNHKGSSLSRTSEQERRKGVPWSEEEHKQFLLGLEKYGKGDWRSISRHFVISRTPTQVASHAQKYFIRLNSMNKDKRRSSIHDITSVDADPNNPPRSHAGRPPTPIQGGQARGMVTTQQQPHLAPGYMTNGPSVFMPPPGLPPYPPRPRFHSRPVMSSSPVMSMPYPMSQPALHQ